MALKVARPPSANVRTTAHWSKRTIDQPPDFFDFLHLPNILASPPHHFTSFDTSIPPLTMPPQHSTKEVLVAKPSSPGARSNGPMPQVPNGRHSRTFHVWQWLKASLLAFEIPPFVLLTQKFGASPSQRVSRCPFDHQRGLRSRVQPGTMTRTLFGLADIAAPPASQSHPPCRSSVAHQSWRRHHLKLVSSVL